MCINKYLHEVVICVLVYEESEFLLDLRTTCKFYGIFPRLLYKKSHSLVFCKNSNKLIKCRVGISFGKH